MRKVDRISSLPTELLLIILSFLPTRYSVRTSILSTRWRYLFTFVPFLDLDIFRPDESDGIITKYTLINLVDYDNSPSFDLTTTARTNFMNYVSSVLSHYNVNPMEKFKLHCGTAVDHRFASWINSVIFRKVKEIDIFVVLRHLEPLTRDIFSYEMLSVLKLHGRFFLEFPQSACLACLKTLHLRHVSLVVLYGEVLSLSIFPVLEDLVLDNCELQSIHTFDFSHPTIKEISIRRCKCFMVVIDAPSLLYFEFLESGAWGFYGKPKLTSLIEARISTFLLYNFLSAHVIKILVHAVSHARHLYLCTHTIENAFGFPYSELPTFSNLTCLEIGYFSRSAFASLMSLLSRSTHLEAIIFTKGFINRENNELIGFASVPSCVSMYLKNVEFREFAMQKIGLTFEGQLVEYFLRNCRLLKNLKIRFYKSRKGQDEFTKKLLTFPKRSTDCQILIQSNYATKQ